eukprot:TRINITY_DN374_c1_g2_i1.p1 TRINITY_DN374_c1_g2~~TRINITY_DN374_c1_g2_i1.p1  ORF type:complete len:548 (+),score=193.75 TRINITY_DN374_c1_g2_i1:59-1645(+)
MGGAEEYPEQQRPFATVMLNAVQILRCTLPSEMGEKASVSGDVSEELRAELEASGMTLNSILMSPNVVPKDNIQWKGTLLINDAYETDLGCIFTRRQTESACEYLADYPTHLTFTVECVKIDPSIRVTTAAEKALIQRVKHILEDDSINPRHGALPSCVVEERAKETNEYHEVVGPIEPSWVDFIQRHKNVFNVFQYSDQEIRDRGMEDINNISGLRIVLRPCERVQSQATADEADAEVERKLKAHLEKLLAEGDLEYTEVLTSVSENPEFVYYLAPSFSLLMRFLNRNRDLFSWTTDPGQPTKVSLADDSNRKSLVRTKSKKPNRGRQQQQQQQAEPSAPSPSSRTTVPLPQPQPRGGRVPVGYPPSSRPGSEGRYAAHNGGAPPMEFEDVVIRPVARGGGAHGPPPPGGYGGYEQGYEYQGYQGYPTGPCPPGPCYGQGYAGDPASGGVCEDPNCSYGYDAPVPHHASAQHGYDVPVPPHHASARHGYDAPPSYGYQEGIPQQPYEGAPYEGRYDGHAYDAPPQYQ